MKRTRIGLTLSLRLLLHVLETGVKCILNFTVYKLYVVDLHSYKSRSACNISDIICFIDHKHLRMSDVYFNVDAIL